MTKHELMDLIYDKLADNDEVEQFDHHSHTDDMCVVNDKSGEPFIAFTHGNIEYVLSIKENKGFDNWEVYEPTSVDKFNEERGEYE